MFTGSVGAVSDSSGVAAGWYPDPAGRFELRYHNGGRWTADVATDGERYVDPLGTAPPAPQGGPPPEQRRKRNSMAVAAMVLGIVAIGIGWMPFIVALGAVAALLAIVFGVIGLRRVSTTGSGRGFAITGLVTGLVGVLVCVGGVVFTVAVVRELDRYTNPEPNTVTIDRCNVDGSVAVATGTITNLGDVEAGFAVMVEFVRPGTTDADRRVRANVDDVPPGETVTFSVSRAVSITEVDCLVSRVDGPLPFGVEIES